MATFQCQCCGSVDNTACSYQKHSRVKSFKWDFIESLKGLDLCYKCGPTVWRDDKPIEKKEWHNNFFLDYLPLGEYHTPGYSVVCKAKGESYVGESYVAMPTTYNVTLKDGSTTELVEEIMPRAKLIATLMLGEINMDIIDVGVYTTNGVVVGVPADRVYPEVF